MDLQLDQLNAVALDAQKVNGGVWIHLESVALNGDGDNFPLYLNNDKSKPQRALVRSRRCTAIKDAELTQQKTGFTKIRKAKKKERDAVIADNSLLPERTRFSLTLLALENVSSVVEGVQHVTPDTAVQIYDNSSWDEVVDQIMAASFDDTNYQAGPATELGNDSGSSSVANQTQTQTAPKTEDSPA